MGDWTAIDDLIRRASDPTTESLQDAIGPVLATFSPGDLAVAEAVLRRLAEEVVGAPTRPDLLASIRIPARVIYLTNHIPLIVLGSPYRIRPESPWR